MASRTLKGAELNYYTTEHELLAIVWALEKFRSYVYGKPVEIRTDHQALAFLRTSRFLSQRLLRWSLLIQDYDVTITHIPVKSNVLADILSRPPAEANEQMPGDANIYALLARQPQKSILKDLKDIRKLQADDKHLQRLQASEHNSVTLNDNGLIIRETARGPRCYLPQILLKPLVSEIHELYGHVGPRKCVALISESFYCPNLHRHVQKILKSCDSCQRNKTYPVEMQGISKPIITERPNDLLSIDFIGPFPPSKNKARFALPWSFCMKQQNIKIIFSSIRHPNSNIVERYNKEIGRFLRTVSGDDHPSWANWCEAIAEIMNTTVNQTTGFCPLEIQTGQRPERFWTKYVPDFRQQQSHNQICDKARANIEKIGNKRAEMWNKNHKITTLKIGDLVLVKALRVPSSKAQRVAKLLSLYEGPYVVTRIFPEATYELGNPRTQKSRGRYHISNIRPYFLDEGQGEEKGEEAGEDRPSPTNRTVCAAQKDQEETTTPRGSPPCNPDRAEASSGRQPGLLLETAGERSRGSPTIGEADRGSVKINPHKKNGKESEEDSWSETSALSTASAWVDERHRGQDAPRAPPSVPRKRRADDDHDSPRQRQQRTMLMHSWLKEMHGKEINWIPPMFLPPRAPIKPAAEWTSPCSTRPPSRLHAPPSATITRPPSIIDLLTSSESDNEPPAVIATDDDDDDDSVVYLPPTTAPASRRSPTPSDCDREVEGYMAADRSSPEINVVDFSGADDSPRPRSQSSENSWSGTDRSPPSSPSPVNLWWESDQEIDDLWQEHV
ncbi:unnamed protein product, partial [Trichogramma brassicae]